MPSIRTIALIIVCCLLGWVTLQSPLAEADSIPGSTCDTGGFSGRTLSDHTLLGLFAPPTAPFSSGKAALQSGCQLWGDVSYLQVYGPEHQLNVTVEQYVIGVQDVLENVTINGTQRTVPVEQTFRAETAWDNVSLFPRVWNLTQFEVDVPSAYTWMDLEISVNGTGWILWHLTPTQLIPLESTFGAQWAFSAEFSVLLVAISILAAAWGKQIVHRMGYIHSTGKGVAIATAFFLLVAFGIGTSYILDWEWWFSNLGNAGAYALFIVPEFFLMTFIFVFWFRGRAISRIKLQDAGEVEGEWRRKIRAVSVRYLVRDEETYWMPEGVKQALFRLFLGKKAYPVYNYSCFSRHPGVARVEGIAEELIAIPSDLSTELVRPHFEFNVREDPEKGGRYRVKTYDTGVTEKVGKWHLIRFVSGHRADPAVGRNALKQIIDDISHSRSVNEIAKDNTELEDELIDKEAEIEVGKARRARELVRKIMEGLRSSRRESGELREKDAFSKALQEALGEISREELPPGKSAGAITKEGANAQRKV